MNRITLWLFITGLILAFARCQTTDNLLDLPLSTAYLDVEQISSEADCLGPDGGFITTITESPERELLFEQSFIYKSDNFRVLIKEDTIGLILDSTDQVLDTLNAELAWLIRSHHFHKMAAHPHDFFKSIEKEETQEDIDGIWYAAFDPNHKKVRFRIYPNKGRLEILQVLNPENPEELIEITYHSHIETLFGPMATRVDIQQGDLGNYIFQFKSIIVNGKEMVAG